MVVILLLTQHNKAEVPNRLLLTLCNFILGLV